MVKEQQHIAILGASGYTGAELIRLLLQHPYAHIAALSANQHAGKQVGEVFPHLAHHELPALDTIDAINFDTIDTVFCCLPHATTQAVIQTLPKHLTIVDLSADFRLRDASLYEQWYGTPHIAQELQERAVYGLSEHYRDAIAGASLIANPGCYPTCALLPLLPLIRHKMITTDPIIIDAKSGISGAGRSVKQHLLFNELSEGMSAYNVHAHRHIGEIEQELRAAHTAQTTTPITFVPHLIPMKRGMLSTIYVTLSESVSYLDAKAQLVSSYSSEPFVQIASGERPPATHDVRGSNQCAINVFGGCSKRQAIIVSVIDNVMKGASGQAVQNFNITLGIDESTGLTGGALVP